MKKISKHIFAPLLLLSCFYSCNNKNHCNEFYERSISFKKDFVITNNYFFQDSVLSYIEKLEKNKCSDFAAYCTMTRISVYFSTCNYNEAIAYLSGENERLFTYAQQEKIYLGIFNAMKAHYEGDSATQFMMLKEAAGHARIAFEKTRRLDPLADYFSVKSYYQPKELLIKEFDSIQRSTYNEDYLGIINLIEEGGLSPCFTDRILPY